MDYLRFVAVANYFLTYILRYRPQNIYTTTDVTSPPVSTTSPPRQQPPNPHSIINRKALGLDNSDNLSLFSSINGFHGARNPKPPVQPGKLLHVQRFVLS